MTPIGRVFVEHSAALILLTTAMVSQDTLQHVQHIVFWSFFRGFMAIKRKHLIKRRRRVAQPVTVDDLNHPACLEKSTRLGDGGCRAYPNRFDGLTIFRCADREVHLEKYPAAMMVAVRNTCPRQQEFSSERLKK